MIAATEMDYQLWHVAVVPYQTAVVYGLRRRLVIADDDGSCARHVASLPWQPYEKREIYTHADPAYDPAADPGTSRQLSLLSCAGRETSTGQLGDALVDLVTPMCPPRSAPVMLRLNTKRYTDILST